MNTYLCFICVPFLTTTIIYAKTEAKTYTEEYSWRDYEGSIPFDALAGGLDRNGKPIYIGQVLFEDKLIPGKIYENDNKIYFEWNGKEYSAANNVKILCSQQPQKFIWLPTRHDEVFYNLTNKILVKGGFEPNVATYIGRTLNNGETSVGKVICYIDSCHGLFTTDNEKTRVHKVFQILSYDSQIPSTKISCNPLIDVRLGAE